MNTAPAEKDLVHPAQIAMLLYIIAFEKLGPLQGDKMKPRPHVKKHVRIARDHSEVASDPSMFTIQEIFMPIDADAASG